MSAGDRLADLPYYNNAQRLRDEETGALKWKDIVGKGSKKRENVFKLGYLVPKMCSKSV